MVFQIELAEPEEGDDQWKTNFQGISHYGDNAQEVLDRLGVEIDQIVEDAEYYRVHDPRVYGHPSGGALSQVLGMDNHSVSKGNRRQDAPPIHTPDPEKDRL